MHQSVLFRLHNFTFANSSRNISSDISISIHFLCNLSVRFHGQSTAGHSNRGLKRPTFLAMKNILYSLLVSFHNTFAFSTFDSCNTSRDYVLFHEFKKTEILHGDLKAISAKLRPFSGTLFGFAWGLFNFRPH